MAKSSKAETGKPAKKGGGKYTAGAATGLGRLQKTANYGKKAK